MPNKPSAVRATARLALNAAVLVFATLAVMSWLSGRWGLALLWTGSLLVAFAELHDARGATTESSAVRQRLIWLKLVGLGGAIVGAWLTVGAGA